MRRLAAPVRWRQYLCRAGSAHNSVEAASIVAAMTVASIGPSWSEGGYWVRRHCDRAGPNATRTCRRDLTGSRTAISCVPS
jgi:hypothetical protein